MTTSVIALVLGVVVAITAAVIWVRVERPIAFPGRSVMSLDQLYNLFYGDNTVSPGAVREAFDLIGRIFGVPPGMLRPSDRFDGELRIAQGWSHYDSSIDAITDELRVACRGKTVDFSKVHTVDDVVRLISRYDE